MKEKQHLTYGGKTILITSDLSETTEARRKRRCIFQVLKENDANNKSYIQLNYLSGVKGRSRHSLMKENKENLSPEDLL